jgi:hypothetical protein
MNLKMSIKKPACNTVGWGNKFVVVFAFAPASKTNL